MNLPNYFLADLPPEAVVTAGMIRDACQTLKRNREQYLQHRSTPSLVGTISDLAAAWLDPDFPFRKLALTADLQVTGFTATTLERGLDAFFRQLSPENLQALLVQDLGNDGRLDRICAAPVEQQQRRSGIACGPELLVHITAGNIPSPTLLSMILGLLVRSAQFVKCARGGGFLPRLFAHSLYEVEPKLGACLELAEWPGGQATGLETALFAEADCVTATGSDETLASIRQQLPVHLRFVGYGHRVSFGYLTRDSLVPFHLSRLVKRAADDVVAWNQLGCLSPHLFYVEAGGRLTAEQFSEALTKELAAREEHEPRGPIPDESAATIASRRAFYEIRAAHSRDTRQWCSPASTAWTVVYEADARFQLSCLHRFVYVKTVADLAQALRGADAVRGRVSTVGVAAPESRLPEIALQFARWGVTRVCPLGQMQNPPLSWRHDGHPALADLVTWTDVEHGEWS